MFRDLALLMKNEVVRL